jgi:CheY-like chemotaxis protein
MEQLLQMCLEKERVSAADAVVYRLGQIGNADLLKSTNGKPRTLVQAVVSKDRGVRFSALEAIMNINSAKPFAGSSLVAETLVWFSKSEGQSVMLSGHPQMATANQTASLFLGLGYQTDVATTCRELFERAAASPDVEVVFVDARTSQPPVGEFVQRMQQDARTAEIPIAILGETADRRGDGRRQTADGSKGATALLMSAVYPRLASEESARWVRDDLLEKTRSTHHPLFGEKGLCNWESARAWARFSTTRLERAKQALGWLRKIKETERETGQKIYHFDDFDSVVLDALHSERRVKEGLDLAAVVKSPVLQSAIYDLAAQAIYPMEIRDYAGDAFIKSVQTFGILLRGEQIQRLYDRYNRSESESKESQELLGRILDAVEQNRNR